MPKQTKNSAFTIVELLIVIVIIGILASIIVVSYIGMSQKAIVAAIQSDLSSASKQIKLFRAMSAEDNYPTANVCPSPGPTEICLKSSNGNVYSYTSNNLANPKSFNLTATNGDIAYIVTENAPPRPVVESAIASTFMVAVGGIDNDEGYHVVQSLDGGYFMSGTTYSFGGGNQDVFITKYDNDGTLAWSRTWGGSDYDNPNSTTNTSDGGCLVAGETYSFGSGSRDAFLAKYSSGGNLDWSRTWGGNRDDVAKKVIQTDDNGFVIVGVTGSYGADDDVFIAKYTSTGGLVWSRTWGGLDWRNWDEARDVIQASDGGYVLAGSTESFGAGQSDAFIVKYDNSGNYLWSRTWGGNGWDAADSLVQTSDGGFVISGPTYSYGAGDYDIFIAKFSSAGALLWSRVWGSSNYDHVYNMIKSTDGSLIIHGEISGYDAGDYLRDAFIIKFSADGDLLWDKKWGGDDIESVTSLIQASDGGYVAVGYTYSYDNGSHDAFLVKYSIDGDLLWNRIWGGDGGDRPESLLQSSDGSYVVVGYTGSYGAGMNDAFILKYDSDGLISDCLQPMCQDPDAIISAQISTILTLPDAQSSSPAAINETRTDATSPVVPNNIPEIISTRIKSPIPRPTMTIELYDELVLEYIGENREDCKQWTSPVGTSVKGFLVSHVTELNHDYFRVLIDGIERYNESGENFDIFIDTSDNPGSIVSACFITDGSSGQSFGGAVVGVLYN